MKTQKQTQLKTENQIQSPYFTMKQAQEYLCVERGTIYKWARLGIITIYKIGGATRLKRSELDKALKPVKTII
ncbi:MAG: helix-turn-helix domain-containing protein [Marinifilum sp.]|jgi:excisionase family DNA binding protein|nr:helix-turn-helix domain-containing protein [Marinifilum sp.]